MSEAKLGRRPPFRFKDHVYHQTFGDCIVLTNEIDGLIDVRTVEDREVISEADADDFSFYGVHLIQQIFADGYWYKSCRYFNLLGNAKTIRLLEFLINWHLTSGRKSEWFYCTDDLLIRKAFLSKASSQGSFHALRRLGYIQTKTRVKKVGRHGGVVRRRYVRIDYQRIADAVNKAVLRWHKKYPDHMEGWE